MTTAVPENYQVNEHIYAIDPHLYFTPGPMKIYLVVSKKTALIDLSTSYAADTILQGFDAINQSIDRVDYLLITHHHYDHCGCISALAPKMPKAEICASANTRHVLFHPDSFFPVTLHLYGREFWPLAGDFKPLVGRDVRIVAEGNTIDLGDGVRLKTLELPGHEVGGCGWFEEKTKTIIVGDALGWAFGAWHPAAFPPTFSYFDFLRSLERIMSLDFNQVCWSHSGSFGKQEGMEMLNHAIKETKRWRQVIEAEAAKKADLEAIYLKVLEVGLMPEALKAIYPPNLLHYGTYSIISAMATSLGIEIPAELTPDGWRIP